MIIVLVNGTFPLQNLKYSICVFFLVPKITMSIRISSLILHLVSFCSSTVRISKLFSFLCPYFWKLRFLSSFLPSQKVDMAVTVYLAECPGFNGLKPKLISRFVAVCTRWIYCFNSFFFPFQIFFPVFCFIGLLKCFMLSI